jgi:hypothetical protein
MCMCSTLAYTYAYAYACACACVRACLCLCAVCFGDSLRWLCLPLIVRCFFPPGAPGLFSLKLIKYLIKQFVGGGVL